MTRTTFSQSRTATRLGRLAVGVLIAASAVTATAIDVADARPKSESEIVAAHADRALEALSSWQSSQNPVDYVRFVQARRSAAFTIALELEVDPDLLRREWETASTERQQTVLAALTQLGVPYRRYKSLPNVAFDCSGLTIWAYANAGIEIPRNSRDQFRASEEVEPEVAQAGDLVYYPGHIGIFLGVGTMIHSPNSGSHVQAVTLNPNKSLRFGDVVTSYVDASTSGVESLDSNLVDRPASVFE